MISLIKNVFTDVLQIYKNFFHWNISKLIFSVYGFITGVLLAIVPLILFGIFLYISHLDLDIVSSFLLYRGSGPEFLGALFASPISSIISLLMLGLSAVAVYVGIWYGRLFISRLSLKYISNKTPKYFKKQLFLNTSWIWMYIKITLWIFLAMVGVFLIYVVIFIILTLLFGGISETTSTLLEHETSAFSITTLILTLVFIGIYLYYGFRLSFSYLCFIDGKKTLSSPLSYMKKSYKLTAGWRKIFRFLVIFFIAGLVLSPVNLIGSHFLTVQNDLRAYNDFIQVESQIGKAELSQKLQQDNPGGYNYYSLLSVSYGDMSSNDIISKLGSYTWYSWIFNIFYFFLIYGVFHGVFASFYIRELKKK